MADEFIYSARDGFPLAVQTGGPLTGPMLLLLQGQANSHRWWERLRTAFEGDFRTITLDYRGTGRSRGPVAPWTTASFAADAVEVLDRLGVTRPLVYGTSMGGRVAQMLAIHHPDRVAAMVLAGASPGGPDAVQMGGDVGQTLIRSSGAARLDVLRDLFYTPDWPHKPRDSTLMGDASMTTQEAAAHLRASHQHNAWDALSSIATPTLVLHGEEDRMTPPVNASLLAERIPGAQLRIYPRGRHGFFDEYSARVTPNVIDFLRSNLAC